MSNNVFNLSIADLTTDEQLSYSTDIIFIGLLGKYLSEYKVDFSFKGILSSDIPYFNSEITNILIDFNNSGYFNGLESLDNLSSLRYSDVEHPLISEETYHLDMLEVNNGVLDFNNIKYKGSDVLNILSKFDLILQLVPLVVVDRVVKGCKDKLILKLPMHILKSNLKFHVYLNSFLSSEYIRKFIEVEGYSDWDFNNLGFKAWEFEAILSRDTRNEGYTQKEKLQQILEDFVEGDVVFLYKRTQGKESRLISCNIAIIDKIKSENFTVDFRVINTSFSREDAKLYVNSLPLKVKDLYNHDYETLLHVAERSESLHNLGIGTKMSSMYEKEEFFITKLTNYQDELTTFMDVDGDIQSRYLSAINKVFIILKSWEIPFNEDLFVEEYFSSLNEVDFYHKR